MIGLLVRGDELDRSRGRWIEDSGIDVYGMDDELFGCVFDVEAGVVDVYIVVSGGETWISHLMSTYDSWAICGIGRGI